MDWPQYQGGDGTGQLPRKRRRSVRDTIAESVPTPGKPGWKKFFGFLVTVVTIIVGRKLGLAHEDIQLLTGAGAAYIVGQGLADFGKEGQKQIERTVVTAQTRAGTEGPAAPPPLFKPGPGSGTK